MPADNKTRVDRILDRIRNHRWLSLLIVAGIVVIGLGAVTSAIERISLFWLRPSIVPTGEPAGNAGRRPLTDIARDLGSTDKLASRAALIDLRQYPEQAISMLITSSMLGAVDRNEQREETAFTTVVRDVLTDAGPDAITPLIAEWRRTRTEIFSRFAVYPEGDRRALFSFLWNELPDDIPNADRSSFANATFHGADFSRSRAIDGDFRNASFLQTDLSETILKRSSFVGADFSGAILTGAIMQRANLEDTRGLEEVRNLAYVNLMEATGLSEAQREVAAARGAVWDETVATRVAPIPPHTQFPEELLPYIRYDAVNRVLVWNRGRISDEERASLRKLDLGEGNHNAIFYLGRVSMYLN